MNQNAESYEKEFMPKMHRIGKITGALGVLVSFLPVAVLTLVFGILPKPAALFTAFLTGAASFGIVWFVEPISYFSVLGPIGTYMAFLSGNISNMRVPCSSMAQLSAGVEPGSEQGTIIATIGMAVSIVINLCILTIGVILGSSILSMLPAKLVSSLNYLLPALFGSLLVQFGMKSKNMMAILTVFGILINMALNAGFFKWLPGASNYLGLLSCVALGIGVSIATYREKDQKEGK